ncbi:MAG: carbohydrate ABC transporter permease [Anaerolineae bacterium]
MKLKRMGGLIAALFLALFYLFPFAVVLMNSLKGRVEVLRDPLALPRSIDFSNYADALVRMNFSTTFFNSLIVTVFSILILTVFPSMFAYYLARFENRVTKVVFILLVVSMIVPFQALMIPFASIYGRLNLLNNRWSLIFFYLGFGVSLSTFLYHGFIRTIPVALDESAAIEGANKFQIFWKIIFPILQPTTATIIILNALWIWNDYLLPSLVLFINDRTLPLSTYTFYGQYTSDYGVAMAGLILSITPVILFYIFMQRNILKGIADGAVK